jgi:Tol biopolymer transport system component
VVIVVTKLKIPKLLQALLDLWDDEARHEACARIYNDHVPKYLSLALILLGTCEAQIKLRPFLADLSGDVYDSEISPSGDAIAFTWCRRVDSVYSCGVYTRAVAGGEPRLLFAENAAGDLPLELRWSPDGKWIAYTTNRGHNAAALFVQSATDGAPRQIANTCWGDYAWTGDSRSLIVSTSPKPAWDSDECGLTLFPLDGSLSYPIAKRGGSPGVSPDGRTLAFSLGDRIVLQDLANSVVRGEPRTLVKVDAVKSGPLWIAGGRELLYTTREWTPLHRIAITPGAKPVTIQGIDDHTEIRQLKSAANGAIIAEIDRHDDALWRMDLRSASPSFEKLQSLPHSVDHQRISPDGHRVLFVASGGIWTSDLDGANKRLVTYHREVIVNPRWSPDGQTIAFSSMPAQGNADLRSRLYIVPTKGSSARRLLAKLENVQFCDWSNDGKFLYVSRDPHEDSLPTQQQLWKVELPSERITQIVPNGGGIHAEESVDGKTLYYTNSPYPKLHSVSVGGGEGITLSNTNLSAVFGGAFSVGSDEIYFVPDSRGKERTRILKLNLVSKAIDEIAIVPFEPLTLQLSRDERYLFATSRPNPITSRVLIEGIQ